ncbi:hypothetical protein C8J57DRAFT_945466, partial [Mycena rebaudengoi]
LQICSPDRFAFGVTVLRQGADAAAKCVGGRVVQSVITEHEAIAEAIAEIVGDGADKRGVAIGGIFVKDIIFSAERLSAPRVHRRGKSKDIASRAAVASGRLTRQGRTSPRCMRLSITSLMRGRSGGGNSEVVFVTTQLPSDVVG